MTDLITAEEAQRFLHSTESGPVHWAGLEYFREYARAVITLHGRLADAEAAMTAVVERACLAVSEQTDWPEDEHGRTEQPELFARVINAIRALAPPPGLALVQDLRDRAEKAEAERRMIVSHATMGGTDGVGMSVNDVSVQITALRNELYLEAKAERDRLAAANAALEARVAGLQAYLDTLPDSGATAEQLDAICALAHGRTDQPLVVAALASGKPGEAGE